MPNFRDWIWPFVAVAGTATAAAVVYKYATRIVRIHRDREVSVPVETQESEDVNYEWSSEEESLNEDVTEEQLLHVNKGKNMVLAMFGLLLLILVTVVSLITSWNNNEQIIAFVEMPMFQPFMWIAIGILTAASTEYVMHSSRSDSEISVYERKAVFPHDASDFDLIRQQDNTKRSEVDEDIEHNVSCLARVANGDDEEKNTVPEDDVDLMIIYADELFEQKQYAQAREYLNGEVLKHSVSVETWWRLARACSYLADESRNDDEKKALAFEGLACAKKSYDLNSDSAASNKWMAIMTSTVGDFLDLKEKIAGSYVIRDHIQRAIELDPTDATSHNILGQWCLAFADMSWIEKRAAAAFVGTPPSSTYEEAVQHFKAAETISPGFWKKNVFLLAQTYLKMKQLNDAKVWALKAEAVPVETKEDEEVARNIETLMKQLKL